jgi:hypothetical protein
MLELFVANTEDETLVEISDFPLFPNVAKLDCCIPFSTIAFSMIT